MKKVLIIALAAAAAMTFTAAAVTYKIKYAKTEVITSYSPDERYTLKIYMRGEPEEPFGAIGCGYELYDGSRRIIRYRDTVFNGGNTMIPEDFEICWRDDRVNLIVHGGEQDDKGIGMCFNAQDAQITTDPLNILEMNGKLKGFADERQIIENYLSYAPTGETDDPEKSDETVSELVMLYGSSGFPSVDSGNKTDMAGREYLEEFCRKVSSGEIGSQTLIAVADPRRIIRYGFETADGRVTVSKTWYEFTGNTVEAVDSIVYDAENWDAGEDYLMFSGTCHHEDLYVLTLSDDVEYDAIRTAPLDETCRKFSELDALQIGYAANNVFMENWDENDRSVPELDDIFEYLCRTGKADLTEYPYETDETGNALYYIPEKEFERGIQSVIDIPNDEIKEWYTYNPCFRAYAFRPRGIEEAEDPDTPYLEVTAYENSEDGRIRLTVNAVYAAMGTNDVLKSEVTVRDKGNGNFVIASNKVITKDGERLLWHTDRRQTKLPYKDDFIITQKDIERLNRKALTLADKLDGEGEIPSDTCAVRDGDMIHGAQLERFFHDYEEGKKSHAEVFDIRENGTCSLTAFLCDKGKVNSYFVNVEKNVYGEHILTVNSVNIVDSLTLTPKKYFIYGLRYLIEHASLRAYWRLYPQSEECKEYTDRYIRGMNFETYNLLISDWTEENADSVLMDGLFDDLYRKETGQVFKTEGEYVDAALFEKIMTGYLPVSAEQLRARFEYDGNADVYKYDRVFGGTAYAPFGDVVEYQNHADGSIDLVVDGVWPDYDSDCGFRCFVTVRPDDDGGFKYLSNSVIPMELSIPKLSLY